MADDRISFTIKVDPNYRAMQRGFLEGSNPTAYRRLMSFASLNAARTFSAPIKAAAPRGKTGNLARSVKAKSGRYNKPSGVVGPLFAGRGSKKNPWYRWLVTAGTGGTRRTKRGIVSVKAVGARPFVMREVNKPNNQQRAIDAFYNTFEAFYNNDVFRGRILQFRRTSQLQGMGVSAKSFFGMIGRLTR